VKSTWLFQGNSRKLKIQILRNISFCALSTLPPSPSTCSLFRLSRAFHRSARWARAGLMTTRSRRLSGDRKGKRWWFRGDGGEWKREAVAGELATKNHGGGAKCLSNGRVPRSIPTPNRIPFANTAIPALPELSKIPVVPVVPVPQGGWRRETRLTTLDHKNSPEGAAKGAESERVGERKRKRWSQTNANILKHSDGFR